MMAYQYMSHRSSMMNGLSKILVAPSFDFGLRGTSLPVLLEWHFVMQSFVPRLLSVSSANIDSRAIESGVLFLRLDRFGSDHVPAVQRSCLGQKPGFVSSFRLRTIGPSIGRHTQKIPRLTSAVERKSTQTMVSVSLARSRCLRATIRTTATQETLNLIN